ncbi:MAG: hypothetical protein ABSH12_08555, partial [Endomicrobiales bacterium]
MMRTLFKISKYLLLCAAVIITAAVVFVETDYFKGLVKNVMISHLKPITGGTVTVGKINGNIFTGITFEEVRLGSAGEPLLYAERVDVSYFLPSLFAGRLLVPAIVITRPSLNVTQDAAGHWNFTEIFSQIQAARNRGAAVKAGISLAIGTVRINEGSCVVKRNNKAVPVEINHIHLVTSVGIKRDQTDIRIAACSARVIQPQLSIKDMTGRVEITGSDLKLHDIRIRTEYSRAHIEGTIMNLKYPLLNLTIDCPEISLKDVGAVVPGVRPKGVFSSLIQVKGNLVAFKVDQSLTYNALKIHTTAMVRPGIPAIEINSTIQNLRPCDIMPVFTAYERKACPPGEISLNVRVLAEGGTFDVLHSSVSINIHPSPFAGFNVGESTLSATIDGRLASLEGDIALSDEHFFLSAVGYAGKNAFRLDKLKLSSAHGDINSRGVIGYEKGSPLDMVYRVNAVDLREVSLFIPRVKIDGIVSSTGTITGTMGSPSIVAKVHGQTISVPGYGAESVTGSIALRGGKLSPEGSADVVISELRAGTMTFDMISVHEHHNEKSARLELSIYKSPEVKVAIGATVIKAGKKLYSVDIDKMSISAGTATWKNDGD